MKRAFYLIVIFMISCTMKPQYQTASIHIVGSDTMLILNRLWAEQYMRLHPGTSIYVEGGGSATGIRDLISGKADIAAMSRTLQPEEAEALAEKYHTVGLSFLVAKDALSIYIHPDNPVRNLSIAQLKNIFTGRIKNWKQVGGKNEPIVVVTRPPNSGTYLYFKRHILNEDEYCREAQTLPTTETVVKFIGKTKNAIGYGGIAYGANLVHCKIENVSPTLDNIHKDRYPITRYLYFYTSDTPHGILKQFIDWVLGREGQSAVANIGYIPLWKE